MNFAEVIDAATGLVVDAISEYPPVLLNVGPPKLAIPLASDTADAGVTVTFAPLLVTPSMLTVMPGRGVPFWSTTLTLIPGVIATFKA